MRRGKFLLCVYCHEEYSDPNDYRHHMDEHHKSFTVSTAFAHCARGKDYLKVDLTNLKCRICFTPCETLKEIAVHIRDAHGFSQINMDFDIGMHPYRLNGEKWICALCDSKFASLTHLCRHTTSHYHKFTCDVCGRMYLSNEALKYHTRCAHSGSHSCRRCWTNFPTLELKREHIKTSKSCWSFCCTACGERFCSWEKKVEHLTEVHGREKRAYECPDCELVFSSRKPFYRHYTVVHSDKVYKCPWCELKFSTKYQMEDHRVVHTGEKPFHCDVCSKNFSRKTTLEQHMWIHRENKRFVCLVCEKQFAQKVSLTGHMKSHHPEIAFKL